MCGYVGACTWEFGGRGSFGNTVWVGGGDRRAVLWHDIAKYVSNSRGEGVQPADEWRVWRVSRVTGGATVQAQGVAGGRRGSSGGDSVIAVGGVERGW